MRGRDTARALRLRSKKQREPEALLAWLALRGAARTFF